MAVVINTNYTDTPTGVSPVINIAGLNFGKDFRVQTDKPGECKLTNITSPIGFAEHLRFAARDISNVYSGTTVDAALQAPSKRGVQVLVQLSDIYSATDADHPDYLLGLPVEAHLVLKIPANQLITADMVKTLIGRLLGGLFETGQTSTSRLQALLRGSLIPADL